MGRDPEEGNGLFEDESPHTLPIDGFQQRLDRLSLQWKSPTIQLYAIIRQVMREHQNRRKDKVHEEGSQESQQQSAPEGFCGLQRGESCSNSIAKYEKCPVNENA
jgi:hypothetical protein